MDLLIEGDAAMRVVTATLVGLLVAAPLLAQEPQPRPQPEQPQEREREHVVRRGDTLWDLAGRYLANPFQWPRIHEANTRIVRDPHWIYPDQVLVIPGFRSLVEPYPGTPADATAAVAAVRSTDRPFRTVFYREPPPEARTGPTVLMEPLAERVPVKPGEFYRAEFLASPRRLPLVGRVIRPFREVAQTGDLLPSAHPRDDLYIAYATSTAPPVGERLLVASVEREVPGGGAEMHLIDPRAVVRVVAHDDEVMRVAIEEQFGRVIRDQVVLPLEFYPDFAAASAEPVQGEFDLEARIIEFTDDGPMPGPLARAFINAGSNQGVQVGDIFLAYLPPRRATEWDGVRRTGTEQIPAEAIAELRVVRVQERTSTVVVDHLSKPQLESGLPARRVRKMP
jgi:hypothetical protein